MSDPVDEYFERLERALAEARPAAAAAAGPADGPAVPPAAPSLVAEAFTALLALEDGEPGARPVRLVAGGGDLRVTDALIDEIVRRVLEHLERHRQTHD